MAKTPKSSTTRMDTPPPAPATLWTGTGLCCEAQGDGVPCRGTDGECETCGRALPMPLPPTDHTNL